MINDRNNPAVASAAAVEVEQVRAATPWHQRVSWGAIFAGVVVALLTMFALEMLGVAIGVAAIDPGETRLGPNFTGGVAIWLAVTALLGLFAGGLVTGKLSGTTDELTGVLHGIAMMGVVTFITLLVLTSTVTSVLTGVSSAIGQGLSFVGANLEEISGPLANAVQLNDDTLTGIREEWQGLISETGSVTPLRIVLEDYLLSPEPDDTARQAAIDTLVANTDLTAEQAATQVDAWAADLRQTVDRVAVQTEQVAEDVADAVATTAGIIFMVLVAGTFAAGAGAFVGTEINEDRLEKAGTNVNRQPLFRNPRQPSRPRETVTS